MVVVIMRNDYSVDYGDIFNLACRLSVSFWAKPRERAAAVAKDRVE